MFAGATSFNSDIGGWTIISCENMNAMFWNATSFNGDISIWDVSSVTNMAGTCSVMPHHLIQDIGGWTTISCELI